MSPRSSARSNDHRPTTLGALQASSYRSRSVRDEIRENLIARIRSGETRFPGVIGYDLTVLPQLENALLARHNLILLGLRGQAKTRLLRSLAGLLDEWVPAIAGTPTNDDPLSPISPRGRKLVAELGDDTPIEWLHRDLRYNEKLATPDVTVADLIGDIDPMKIMNRRLTFDDEEAIHYGIIPRSNRGIFAVNELPDLQARIQVALLNILEEGDIQIRGFPVRLPLDVLLVFTANPEDYTNRGSIITPLKDRIDAQILTHYPRTIEDAVAITRQEAWYDRSGDRRFVLPDYVREIVEEVAFQARKSEYVDQNSGVSARMTISFYEMLHSSIERRMIRAGDATGYPRVADLYACLPAVTGKVELVYKGEQEGVENVATMLIGLAVKAVFARYAAAGKAVSGKDLDRERFRRITEWFEKGNALDLNADMPHEDYARQLRSVPGLEQAAHKIVRPESDDLLPTAMEFILEGLYQYFMLSKQEVEGQVVYVDSLRDMMRERDEDEPFRGIV